MKPDCLKKCYDRCNICFEVVDRYVQRGSEGSVSVATEKANERALKEELCYCVREFRVTEMRVVHDV